MEMQHGRNNNEGRESGPCIGLSRAGNRCGLMRAEFGRGKIKQSNTNERKSDGIRGYQKNSEYRVLLESEEELAGL